jgi:diguanylate cyclase (GGDEF)-like protein
MALADVVFALRARFSQRGIASGTALIDPLTGMLNRQALVQRVDELAQQSPITRRPIGLIVGDIDHFEQVHDAHADAAGEAVLKDVASQLRRTLRAFDLAYRTGAEQFLVLLPGADLHAATDLAEVLRAAVANARHDGRRITMSFGAAASSAEHGFHYESVFAEATAALHRARQSGRNRVWPPPHGGLVMAA